MRCSKCGSDNRETRKFCAQCGTPLAAKCARCGASNEPGEKFCGDCGSSLAAGAPNAGAEGARRDKPQADIQFAVRVNDSADAALDGERKTVTALFADIKGSMELIEDLDPEEARAVVDPALKLMMDAVHHYGGYVAQSTGDGIFALFGAPVAHEDHPQRALYAGLRLQDEMRRYSVKLRAAGNPPVEARVGVNTGEVVVRSIATGEGQAEYTPIGHSTSLAARMQVLAPTSSVATTDATRRLGEGYFTFKSLGPTVVKGVSEPVEVYEVTGLGPLRTRLQRSAGRGLTKFVGREREMEALKHALEQAGAGHGQIVAAMAEPGVGKSRLFYEFKATSQSGWMVLEAFSVSHGKATAYLPLIELLHVYFDVKAEDDGRKRREKITGRILALDRKLEDTLPYLFSLMGVVDGDDPFAQMDRQIKQRRTLEGIKRILLRESLNQPLMIVFEDLHWIDGETQTLLNLLADSIGTAKILLLVNYRPDYSDQWNSKTYYTRLRLDPLGRESADEMLAALLGSSEELAALKRLIVDKTQGNPFFMEEIVQGLFEQGALARNGEVKLAKSLRELTIPSTVQAMLAARIDRLTIEEKELLQTLAVLGREFPLALVKRVTLKPDDDLERILSRLQAGELIYEQLAPGDVEYTFKHAVTQEVAYNGLLVERRKLLHERAGQALESMFAEQLNDHVDELAHHYSLSGNHAKAVEYLVRAGDQAHQRSTFAEAAGYFEAALKRLEELPLDAQRDRWEIAVCAGLADVTIVTSGYAAAEYERHLTRRYEIAERLGDATQLFFSLVGVSVLATFRLELKKAREIGGRLLALADEALDPRMQLEAHGSLANILWHLGDFRDAREHCRGGLALFAPNEHLPAGREHWRAAFQFYDCLCAATLGFSDEGLQRSLEFLARARERALPLPLAFATNCVSTVFVWRRESEQALKYADALVTLTVEQGFSNWHSFAQIDRGHALALSGKGDEAIAAIKRAIASYEATGAVVPGWMHSSLAFGYLAAMQPAEGLRVVAKGLEVGDKTGDAEAKSELQRLKGELLLMCDPTATAQAETSFRAAIDTSREQHARLCELRATMSLARLLAKQDRYDEARAMLADIYGWFTEGFDTADLKDAKALLDELSRQ